MAGVESRGLRNLRLLQALVIVLSVVLVGVGAYLGLHPAPTFYLGVAAGVAGALLLTLGLRGLDVVGSRNRVRVDAHLRQVKDQVRVLAGESGSRQGIWMGDWRNARWRDLGQDGGQSTYARLPLLVRPEDLKWAIRDRTNTNTGVPIDEIDGMILTIEHLGSGRGSLYDALLAARECLAAWREFDGAFEHRLLVTARGKLLYPPLRLAAGWEDIPWFPPRQDTWRLGATAFVGLTMPFETPTARPTFHDPGPGDEVWTVRYGSGSQWLLQGSPPAPTDSLAEEVLGIVEELRMDPVLRPSFIACSDKEAGVRDRIRTVRGSLSGFDPSVAECTICRGMTVVAPTTV